MDCELDQHLACNDNHQRILGAVVAYPEALWQAGRVVSRPDLAAATRDGALAKSPIVQQDPFPPTRTGKARARPATSTA